MGVLKSEFRRVRPVKRWKVGSLCTLSHCKHSLSLQCGSGTLGEENKDIATRAVNRRWDIQMWMDLDPNKEDRQCHLLHRGSPSDAFQKMDSSRLEEPKKYWMESNTRVKIRLQPWNATAPLPQATRMVRAETARVREAGGMFILMM